MPRGGTCVEERGGHIAGDGLESEDERKRKMKRVRSCFIQKVKSSYTWHVEGCQSGEDKKSRMAVIDLYGNWSNHYLHNLNFCSSAQLKRLTVKATFSHLKR